MLSIKNKKISVKAESVEGKCEIHFLDQYYFQVSLRGSTTWTVLGLVPASYKRESALCVVYRHQERRRKMYGYACRYCHQSYENLKTKLFIGYSCSLLSVSLINCLYVTFIDCWCGATQCLVMSEEKRDEKCSRFSSSQANTSRISWSCSK